MVDIKFIKPQIEDNLPELTTEELVQITSKRRGRSSLQKATQNISQIKTRMPIKTKTRQRISKTPL
jgi:hypothetical protein